MPSASPATAAPPPQPQPRPRQCTSLTWSGAVAATEAVEVGSGAEKAGLAVPTASAPARPSATADFSLLFIVHPPLAPLNATACRQRHRPWSAMRNRLDDRRRPAPLPESRFRATRVGGRGVTTIWGAPPRHAIVR